VVTDALWDQEEEWEDVGTEEGWGLRSEGVGKEGWFESVVFTIGRPVGDQGLDNLPSMYPLTDEGGGSMLASVLCNERCDRKLGEMQALDVKLGREKKYMNKVANKRSLAASS
jgi:hypothetical protein